ncbi:hypothetical protein GCM10022247_56720 [Allokutzneria multivorans]|uniref:Uncharacterized protein n=1 Tax=Allokutzneria multivorans TaxID=1142134 RepID=A0ABP7TFT1_9PSEU
MFPNRSSFAFNGGGNWRWYEPNGINLPMREARQCAALIEATQGQVARDDFISAIMTKIKKAERGELEYPDDAKAGMARSPDINELKWRLEDDEWRLYYSEPIKLHAQRGMLGLHFDVKPDLDHQDRSIDEAARRNKDWHETVDTEYRQ